VGAARAQFPLVACLLRRHRIGLALLVILLLLAAILAFLVMSCAESRGGVAVRTLRRLVAFAAVLNGSIWLLN